MNMKRYIIPVVFFLAVATAQAQTSQSFTVGKWIEVHNAVLKELSRSYVDSLPVDRMERAGIDAMLSSLDPYTVYVPEEEQENFTMMIGKSYGGIGAIIYKPDVQGNVIINEPYADSPAARNGLRCGDEIISIDGESTHGLTSQQASDKMKGKPGTTVVFKVKKLRAGATWAAGDVIEVPVVRERIHLPDVEYYGMLNDTTGYIYQSGFTEGVAEAVKNAVLSLKAQGMRRLVLDLRGNGGGIMQEAVSIVGLFVPRGSLVVSSKGLDARSNEEYRTTREPVDTSIPIIVMVDSGSASASEIVSGALQDLDRATIIGGKTYGKGLIQSVRPLPYDGQLKVTTGKYYTPSGRCVQAIDYASRNDDGSVGHIPDSLTREFKTARGRTVRDGGGVTPDHIVPAHNYSRITYSLVYSGIIEQYALEYVRKHESIPAVEDFRLSDAEYEDFISFARGKEFDSRSSAKALFDEMKKSLDRDGLTETASAELDALDKVINIDKETFLRLKKSEIVQFIEEEIVVRYYFQAAGIRIRLRYDDQLREAHTLPSAV